ncbi:MAG: choice-of-anchor Q domain-containing protein, partial [Planctomycetota bacterium]
FVVNNSVFVDGGVTTSGNGTSLEQAFKSIQEAIDGAVHCDMILVADGTYTGPNNRNIDFAGKAIHLKSINGALNCIIDCQRSGRGFYFHSGEIATSIVEGFTIRNGEIDGAGGGVYASSSPTIKDCIITGNTAHSYGGGIYLSSSSALITGCSVTNNTTNQAGGGVYLSNSSATLNNCIITNNVGDGSSYGSGGGVYFNSSHAVLNGCLIADNTSRMNGAGTCLYISNPTLNNCTIANNSATGNGGAFNCHDSNPTLNNSIIWSNTASAGNQINGYGSSRITLNYCDYADNSVATNNISASVTSNNCMILNPLFINVGGGNYQLQAASPCKDAGLNSYILGIITVDANKNPRIVNGVVDFGAYEYQ